MRTDCDRRWEIDALREGSLSRRDAEAFARHTRGCDVCKATMLRDAHLRRLAAALPPIEPNDLDLRRLRGRVLRQMATGPRPRRAPVAPFALGLALTFLTLVSWAVVRSGSRPPESRISEAPSSPPPANIAASPLAGVVLDAEGARWSQTRQGLVERIQLEDGTMKIHVRRLIGAERFLIELPDGELEVRGTTFEVSVRGSATEHIYVDEGVIAVRLKARPGEFELRNGGAWNAPKLEAPAGELTLRNNPAGAGRPPLRHASPSSRPAPNTTDDGTDAYAAAIALLQGGHYSAAASAFHRFLLEHPQASQAEDASFLEASSLARAGRPDAASLAAEDHLARFAKSFHRREAAILIARAARDRGDCAQARNVLSPWLGAPPDDEVRATVERCVDTGGAKGK